MKNVIDYIIKNDSFLISSHINPDGDNIGSSMAMYLFLKKIGKKVEYILDDNYPENLIFLYNSEAKKTSSEVEIDGKYSVITLDCGDYNRVCMDKSLLDNAEEIICIDHHMNSGEYASIKYIDEKESSTCELVFNLLRKYEDDYKTTIIDDEIATYLYTGLVTDTGNFMYSNTKVSSYLMAATLIERGADKNIIIQNIYQNNKTNFLKALGEALKNIEVIDSKIAVMYVSKAMLNKYSLKYDDIDGMTPYCRDIEGVELGIFIKEKEVGEIKVSLRSKNYMDCTALANNFGGGGHIRAAGVSFRNQSIEEVKNKLVNKAKEMGI